MTHTVWHIQYVFGGNPVNSNEMIPKKATVKSAESRIALYDAVCAWNCTSNLIKQLKKITTGFEIIFYPPPYGQIFRALFLNLHLEFWSRRYRRPCSLHYGTLLKPLNETFHF